MRHEIKHRLNPQDDFILTSRLQTLFSHDEHAGSHGSYRVSSLYFDSPYDKAVKDKLAGVNERFKIRLRYYGDEPTFIRLENKMKIGQLTNKISIKVTLAEATALIAGDPTCLLSANDPARTFFYTHFRNGLLRPVVQVIYEREAFTYLPGNVRVTLDRHLKTKAGPEGFFLADTPRLDVSDGLTVLEVKYDAFLPEIVKLAVQTPNRRHEAVSKYIEARRYE